jgi:hypothetical protein
MTSVMYDAVAYAMRYWFIFVVLVILIALIVISARQIKEKKYAMTELGKYFGYVEITDGPKTLIGDRFGLREDNLIGSGGNADIMITGAGLARSHAQIYMEGDVVIFAPEKKRVAQINGRRAVNPHAIKTGDVLSLGKVEMLVYLKRKRLKDDS